MITWEQPWLTAGDKLICFGDSITEAPNGYVLMLQELLAPRKIEVINAGRGGDKTPWALTRLEASVIQPKPAARLHLSRDQRRLHRPPALGG